MLAILRLYITAKMKDYVTTQAQALGVWIMFLMF